MEGNSVTWTQRQRAVFRVTCAASGIIQREADANEEHPWEATRKRVHTAIEEAAQGRFDTSWDWRRFRNEVVRQIEGTFEVRPGWWS
jgi:hypothetical protein